MPAIRAWLTKERAGIFAKAMLAIVRSIPLPAKRRFVMAPPKFRPRLVTSRAARGRATVKGEPEAALLPFPVGDRQRAFVAHTLQSDATRQRSSAAARGARASFAAAAPPALDAREDLLIGHRAVLCVFGDARNTLAAVEIAEEDFHGGTPALLGVFAGMRAPLESDFCSSGGKPDERSRGDPRGDPRGGKFDAPDGAEASEHFAWVEWRYRKAKRVHRIALDPLDLSPRAVRGAAELDCDDHLPCVLSRWDTIAERFLPIACFALPLGASGGEGERTAVLVPRETPPGTGWRIAWRMQRGADPASPTAQLLSRVVAASVQVVLTLHATWLEHHGGEFDLYFYRYILCESCSQFDLLPLIYL